MLAVGSEGFIQWLDCCHSEPLGTYRYGAMLCGLVICFADLSGTERVRQDDQRHCGYGRADRVKCRLKVAKSNLFFTILGALVITFLLSQIDLADLATRLARTDRRWVVIAYLCVLVGTVLRSIRYSVYFSARGYEWRLLGAFAFMRALNTAMPFRSGEVVFVGLLKRLSLAPSIAEVTPVWLALRTADLLAASLWSIVLVLSGPFALSMDMASGGFWAVWTAGAIIISIALASVVVPRVLRADRLAGYVQGVRLGVARLRGRREAAAVLLLSLMLWFFLIAFPVALLKALNAPLSTHEGLVVAGIMAIVSMLPVHGPLGLGTGDGAWASLLAMTGLSFSAAVTIALGIRILSLGLVAVDGIIGALLVGRRQSGRAGGLSPR